MVASCSAPWTRVIPVGLPESSLVAKLPSVATTFGSISEICRKRWPSQASISSGWGSRLPGGRHLSTFATYTRSRSRPIPASSLSSSLPACPTKGLPCWSSWNPGASPTNIRSALGSPTPKTTWVRPSASRHLVQPATSAAKAASSVAATASAATTARRRSAKARLLGGAVSREDGELLAHVLGAAIGTVGIVTVPDELLEMRLALHTHVLVDRHRHGSVSRIPDAPRTSSIP